MNYRKLRNLLFDLSFNDDNTIPKDFLVKNKEYLMKYVDNALRNYCKFIFYRDARWFKKLTILLASLLTSYGLIKLNFIKLNLKDPLLWLCVILIHTNYSFIFSNSIYTVFHRVHIKSNVKVKMKKSVKDLFGYYLAYVGLDSKGELVVISMNRFKKSIQLTNPKVFVLKSGCEYPILVHYLYDNDVKDVNWIEKEIFLDVKSEYFKFFSRQYAMNELEKMQEMENR